MISSFFKWAMCDCHLLLYIALGPGTFSVATEGTHGENIQHQTIRNEKACNHMQNITNFYISYIHSTYW